MESPPHKLNVGRDEDRISALPDHLLLDILERLDLREAVRAGALSTRWRHLPKHLSRVHLDVVQFRGATPLQAMDAFTGAARALLNVVPPVDGQCERGALKVLILSFYISSAHLSSIGRLIEDIVSFGQTECLEFCLSRPPSSNTIPLLPEIGQQFMSFSRAYPVAFSWLTRLTLDKHAFGNSDVTDLINACGRLRHLTLSCCRLIDPHSTLKIDVPCSGVQELVFFCFWCTWIELISVPKLRQVVCHNWLFENSPVCFGYVPELRVVQLFSKAMEWQQAPFALSECLSRSATNLSELYLDFRHQMVELISAHHLIIFSIYIPYVLYNFSCVYMFFLQIWIQPEHPKQLTAIFRNLTDVFLSGIFSECDLNWTLFILDVAPALKNIVVSVT